MGYYMGRDKEFLEEIEDVLRQIAIQSGAIRECILHPGSYVYEGGPELDSKAYAMATNEWKEGGLSGTREMVLQALKQILSETPYQCTGCTD